MMEVSGYDGVWVMEGRDDAMDREGCKIVKEG